MNSQLVALKQVECFWVVRNLIDSEPGAVGYVQDGIEDVVVGVAHDKMYLAQHLHTQLLSF